MKSICIVLSLSLTLIANGQQSASVSRLTAAAEGRAREILQGLESDNELRLALERGERGDGTHHGWMDKMQRLGIKHAAYVLDFDSKDQVGIIQVNSRTFLREYYRDETRIKDRKLLRQVRDSGLEEQLTIEILARAHEVVLQLFKNGNQKDKRNPRREHITFSLNLLDDEALPILDETPKVER